MLIPGTLSSLVIGALVASARVSVWTVVIVILLIGPLIHALLVLIFFAVFVVGCPFVFCRDLSVLFSLLSRVALRRKHFEVDFALAEDLGWGWCGCRVL